MATPERVQKWGPHEDPNVGLQFGFPFGGVASPDASPAFNMDNNEEIPHYALAVIISHDEKKVILQRRPWNKPLGNKWEIPGGRMEQNETAVEAAQREATEEIGAPVLTFRAVAQFEFRGTLNVGREPSMLTVCSAVAPKGYRPRAIEGQPEVRWMDMEDSLRIRDASALASTLPVFDKSHTSTTQRNQTTRVLL